MFDPLANVDVPLEAHPGREMYEMSDDEGLKKMAEAYWKSIEPDIKRPVIEAFMRGAAHVTAAVADWVATMPVAPGATTSPRLTPAPANEEAASSSPAARRRASSAPRRSRSARPLKGLSAAAYDIVKGLDVPIGSRDLLHLLRERDDMPTSEGRDNSLMAAMRRLRDAGYLDYENGFYSMPKSPSR